MAVYTNQRFDAEVDMADGSQFFNCTFGNTATLKYSGGKVLVSDCVIEPNCAVTFHGPALETVNFLRLLRATGFPVDRITAALPHMPFHGHKKPF